MKLAMRIIGVMLSMFFVMSIVGCGNPRIDAGKVGYVTNEPILFGEKGEYLDILVGPSSYGFGWRNKIKYAETFKPFTIKEYFSPKNGVGENKEQDTRIMSADRINMEASTSVVLCLKNSPALDDYNESKFKTNAKEYFENWLNFWPDRYKEPFRTKTRNLLGKETYSSAKDGRDSLGAILKDWLAEELKNSPLVVLSVNISNINPPQRILAEEELLKATEIAKKRQKNERELQIERKAVMDQEATNLASALRKSPKYLIWRDLEIKQKYVDGFNNLITGEEAKSISKAIFVPYGTPVAANPGQ